ncbi:MAG: chromate efflux transporter [Negativicutes bacterium]|jgi:chromate transporter
MNKPKLFDLFKLFLCIGATGFGGVAMLPVIRAKLVDQKKYLSGEQYDYGIALAQMLPGPTIVQVAAFTGYSLYGYVGGLLCSLGIFAPAAIMMYILTVLYFAFQNAAIIAHIVAGMSAVIIVIVLQATCNAARTSLTIPRDYVLAIIGFTLFFLKQNAVMILILSAILGMLFCRNRKPLEKTTRITHYPLWQIILMFIVTVAIFATTFLINPQLGKLAYYMTKTSFLAFGGGYAAIPIFIHDVVNSEHWQTLQQFMVGIMLGQITPGPVIVTATYIGYDLLGSWGALIATFFVFAPAYLLAMFVTPVFNKLINNKYFFRAVLGILCAFPGMLLSVSVTMLTELQYSYLTFALLFFSAVMLVLKKMSPYKVILLAATVEIAAFYIK